MDKTAAAAYPRIPNRLAIAYVAVSMVIQSYSSLLSIFPILAFLALWLPHAFYKKQFVLQPTKDLFYTLFFPALCLYSAFWSDYPARTAYQGLELVVMAVCVIIIARTVSIEAFLRGLSLGIAVTLAATLASGRYAQDYFSQEYSLVGLFGSKNSVGWAAEIGIFVSLLIFFSKASWKEKLVFAAAPLAVSAVCLYKSNAAGAVLSLAAVLAACVAVYLLSKVPRMWRLYVVALGLFAAMTAAVVVMALDLDISRKILSGFGKDTTLTGRTYLWSEGIRNGMDRPLLGYGYGAFWVPGQPMAEKYWDKFLIPDKTGFHFHNLFIQSFVDVGILGVLSVTLIILANLWKGLRLSLRCGLYPEHIYAFGISLMFLVRAFIEVDLEGPFGFGTLLFFTTMPRLAAWCLQAKEAT